MISKSLLFVNSPEIAVQPTTILILQIFRDVPSSATSPTNLQLDLTQRRSIASKAPSCSERPLTLFHTPTNSQKGEHNRSFASKVATL